jgi:spore coat polysaccharide biosynthesis protein SpsF
MRPFKTEQESFWAGEFGDEYVQRNQGDELLDRKSVV